MKARELLVIPENLAQIISYLMRCGCTIIEAKKIDAPLATISTVKPFEIEDSKYHYSIRFTEREE